MRRATLAAWLASAGVLGGCAGTTAPAVRVTGARVTERSAEGVVVEVTLEADNRNESELPLREVRYAVEVDGLRVFEAVRSPEATLRRVGTQTVRFPAVIPGGHAALAAESVVRIEGGLWYQNPGEIARLLYDTGMRRPRVRFEYEASAREIMP